MAKDQLKPRLCRMLKGESGYGFHLHGEKGKSGQFIRKVEPGSPAEAAGLRAGDRVVEVNGLNVEQETHHQDLNGQKELCPRLCHLKKGPNGYGFNLHSEKSRPGQFIRSVDPDSPASRSGLRPQDRLVEVNGINVEGLRHSEVVSHIKSRENEARLLVVDPETDDYFKKLGVTPTEEHTKGVVPQPMTNGSAQTQLNGGSTSSSHSDLQSPGKESEDGDIEKKDPFEESGLSLSPTAAEAKEKVRAKRVKKRAPQMDWNKKREIFSNF
ncbi:Na(+)/H(+) exchange regulatory cofactor NHE-RF2 isoform X4 [Pezoporus wallicus]|uniref:Na(+)/H(+) exchange regulatory cofactor NHE-RF2 isoform X4 n=1 Tax=Pezoporus wallicus TaxID=35540 RepID=UPI0025518B39|nr:Na(+)/H(+) exchange regulatory cofactor NHE-RF2 isoform X4 [Pezoporus wallicus]XP_061205165.1 Na(+)/H(+) exchange regulatory cofactor NHE-RF2 isoform X4 [Neopsephotus bourkii]